MSSPSGTHWCGEHVICPPFPHTHSTQFPVSCGSLSPTLYSRPANRKKKTRQVFRRENEKEYTDTHTHKKKNNRSKGFLPMYISSLLRCGSPLRKYPCCGWRYVTRIGVGNVCDGHDRTVSGCWKGIQVGFCMGNKMD